MSRRILLGKQPRQKSMSWKVTFDGLRSLAPLGSARSPPAGTASADVKAPVPAAAAATTAAAEDEEGEGERGGLFLIDACACMCTPPPAAEDKDEDEDEDDCDAPTNNPPSVVLRKAFRAVVAA